MGKFNERSRLKSKTIKKVWLNKKNYKFLDFNFKVTDIENYTHQDYFNISMYNCDVLILKLYVTERMVKEEERFKFEVKYFNPQTNNDCFSINHVLAVCSESTAQEVKHKDRGNAEIIKNQFIFRKKTNYYSYTKIWGRGEIKDDNHDKHLSYEFATDEYVTYIKKIFGIERMQGRKLKKYLKDYLNKVILLEGLKPKKEKWNI